jgi:hypothetical protein
MAKAKTFTVTYDEGPSGSVEVDTKRLIRGGEPVRGIGSGQLKRLRALEGHKFTATENKETDNG